MKSEETYSYWHYYMCKWNTCFKDDIDVLEGEENSAESIDSSNSEIDEIDIN